MGVVMYVGVVRLIVNNCSPTFSLEKSLVKFMGLTIVQQLISEWS